MMNEQTEEEAEKKRARMVSEEQKENVIAPLDMSDTARPSPPRQSPRIEIKISRADSYEKDLRPSSAEVEEAKEAREHSRSRSTERTTGEEEEGEEDGSNERRNQHGTKEKGTADADRARQRRRQMEIRELARSRMATAMSKQAQKKKGNRANTKATSGQGEGAQIRTGSEGSNTSGRVRSRVLGFKRRHTITVAVSPQTVRSLPTSPVSVTGLSSLRSLEDAMSSSSSSSSSAARRGRRASVYSGTEAGRTKRSTAAGGTGGGLLQGAKHAKGLKKSATLDVQGRHLLMTKLKEEKQRRMREEAEEEEDEVEKENRSDGAQQSSTATSLKDEMSIEPKEKEKEDDHDDDSKKAESSSSIEENTVDVKNVENTMTGHQSQNSDSNTQQEASSSVSSSSSVEAGESTNQVVETQPFIQIRCGVYSMQGRRKHMEDMHECHPSLDLAGLTASGSFPSQSSLDSSSEDSEEETSPLSSQSSQYGGTSQSLSLDDSLQNNSNNNSEREDEDNISEELKRSFEEKMQAPLLEGNDSAEGCTAAPLCAFFGVYDGHGGKRASEFVARVLHEKIMNHPSFGLESGKHVPTAIKDAFLQTEDEFMKLARASNIGDGTTAIVAFILKTTLFLGNVGDSEAMLCRDNKAIFFREMVHNPAKNPLEITRIEKVGGRLYHNRLAHPNLNPAYFSLGVSRSIGDSMFKNPDYTKGKPSGLTAEADVQQIELTADDQFLVLACDGLWDVMDHQMVADFVLSSLREKDDPQAASQELVEEAYRRGSTDNITAVVCAFKELKEPVYEEDTEEEELSQERERLLTTTQEEEFESDSGSVKELEEEEEMMHQEVEEH